MATTEDLLAARREEMLEVAAVVSAEAESDDFKAIYRYPTMYRRKWKRGKDIKKQVLASPQGQAAKARGMRRAWIVSTEHRGSSKWLSQFIEPDTRLHVGVIFFNFRADSPCTVEHVVVV